MKNVLKAKVLALTAIASTVIYSSSASAIEVADFSGVFTSMNTNMDAIFTLAIPVVITSLGGFFIWRKINKAGNRA